MANDAAVNDIVMLEGGPLIDGDALTATLGWSVKPEGLCRDDTCVIVPDDHPIRSGDLFDATAIASLLDRPSAVDAESGLVAIGAPRELRRTALDDLKAPEFVLPDIDGMPVALSDHRSKKRLLVAFSSW